MKNVLILLEKEWLEFKGQRTLIAGVLIQASRFLMAALVDVSTIATYAVGGLPLSVIKNTDIGKQKILKVNSLINLDKFSAFTKTRMWYLLIGRFYIPVFRFNITYLFYFYFLCIIKS